MKLRQEQKEYYFKSSRIASTVEAGMYSIDISNLPGNNLGIYRTYLEKAKADRKILGYKILTRDNSSISNLLRILWTEEIDENTVDFKMNLVGQGLVGTIIRAEEKDTESSSETYGSTIWTNSKAFPKIAELLKGMNLELAKSTSLDRLTFLAEVREFLSNLEDTGLISKGTLIDAEEYYRLNGSSKLIDGNIFLEIYWAEMDRPKLIRDLALMILGISLKGLRFVRVVVWPLVLITLKGFYFRKQHTHDTT